MEKLIKIQNELKTPKNQYNAFGKYKYRNQEDILEAVKPLLKENQCTLVIKDEVKEVCGNMFIEATVIFDDGTNSVQVTAQAGIDLNRKGMDVAQSFGSSSSYARKYALNGLFLIDDTKDADATNTHDKTPKKEPLTEKEIKVIEGKITASTTKEQLTEIYNSDIRIKTHKELLEVLKLRKESLV